MCTLEPKIRHGMIERAFVEKNYRRFTTTMLTMTLFAGNLALLFESPVVSLASFNILGHVFVVMASQAQIILYTCFKFSVACLAIMFNFCMCLGDFSRTEQRLYRITRCTRYYPHASERCEQDTGQRMSDARKALCEQNVIPEDPTYFFNTYAQPRHAQYLR